MHFYFCPSQTPVVMRNISRCTLLKKEKKKFYWLLKRINVYVSRTKVPVILAIYCWFCYDLLSSGLHFILFKGNGHMISQLLLGQNFHSVILGVPELEVNIWKRKNYCSPINCPPLSRCFSSVCVKLMSYKLFHKLYHEESHNKIFHGKILSIKTKYLLINEDKLPRTIPCCVV